MRNQQVCSRCKVVLETKTGDFPPSWGMLRWEQPASGFPIKLCTLCSADAYSFLTNLDSFVSKDEPSAEAIALREGIQRILKPEANRWIPIAEYKVLLEFRIQLEKLLKEVPCAGS